MFAVKQAKPFVKQNLGANTDFIKLRLWQETSWGMAGLVKARVYARYTLSMRFY